MKLKYFDAHTHLNMLGADWREAGKRAIENGVWFVNVGADEKSSRLALEQIKELGELVLRSLGETGGCWATAGIHPTESDDSNFEVIKELAQDEKIVAIGECGLEYFKLKGNIVTEKERQKKLFKQHLELALEISKPLMIHCRPSPNSVDAYNDLYEILNDYKKRVGDKLKFNLHFFTSDWSTARKFLDLGGYLSFPGVITFANQSDEVIKNAPLDRIMAETDAPFAAPKVDPKAGFATLVPHRGQPNEPAFVQFVAERITLLRSEPREEVLTALAQNAKRFYHLN